MVIQADFIQFHLFYARRKVFLTFILALHGQLEFLGFPVLISDLLVNAAQRPRHFRVDISSLCLLQPGMNFGLDNQTRDARAWLRYDWN